MLANLPAGYCVSPNNINNLPGVEIYAAGPGVAEPADRLTEGVINLREDGRILVGGRKASPGKLEFVVSREFANAAEFLAYYATAGKISEPGAPCGYRNVWD